MHYTVSTGHSDGRRSLPATHEASYCQLLTRTEEMEQRRVESEGILQVINLLVLIILIA
jgi:hypothetical protein